MASLCEDFPAVTSFRVPDIFQLLSTFQKNPAQLQTSPLGGAPPSPRLKTHLPLEALAYGLLPLVQASISFPVTPTHLLPHDICPAPHAGPAYRALKRAPPHYYRFPLLLLPYPFTDLRKLIAKRIHQIRAKKRYLAAHPFWVSDHSPMCPRCAQADEDLETHHPLLLLKGPSHSLPPPG